MRVPSGLLTNTGSSFPTPPTQALPEYSGKSGDKGKRGPPQQANRNQQPHKFARNDILSHPIRS